MDSRVETAALRLSIHSIRPSPPNISLIRRVERIVAKRSQAGCKIEITNAEQIYGHGELGTQKSAVSDPRSHICQRRSLRSRLHRCGF